MLFGGYNLPQEENQNRDATRFMDKNLDSLHNSAKSLKDTVSETTSHRLSKEELDQELEQSTVSCENNNNRILFDLI